MTESLDRSPPCGDCGSPMVLRGSKYGLFYGCSTYPECRGTHGAHKNGTPYGIPANKATRIWREQAHDAFDTLWKGADAVLDRDGAYIWMSKAMHVSRNKAHIGNFSVFDCRRLIALVQLRGSMKLRK